MTEEEAQDIEAQKIPYMYVALLHYTSRITGDSVEKINAEIEHSCNFEIQDNTQKLNG
jgi:hypothetical protein